MFRKKSIIIVIEDPRTSAMCVLKNHATLCGVVVFTGEKIFTKLANNNKIIVTHIIIGVLCFNKIKYVCSIFFTSEVLRSAMFDETIKL